MMKKFIATVLTATLALSPMGCAAAERTENVGNREAFQIINSATEGSMSKVKEQFDDMIEHPEKFPVNFVYDDVYYSGFGSKSMKELSRKATEEDGKLSVKLEFQVDATLKISLESVYYAEYDAFDYTVYFENNGNKNSGVIEKLNAVDITVAGRDAVLKGILGDHVNQHSPYEYDLKERDVNFTSRQGRATHIYFPYFNLENADGGALFAIGWAGTWQADFAYDKEKESTRFVGTGTLGLKTYLKPGEKVRTPLIAAVFYGERDEDKAMNKWRQWVINCNLPRDSASTDEPVKPSTSTCFDVDTGRPTTDGSISERFDTWQNTYDALIKKGLKFDFRWFDAGWYEKPDGTENTNLDWFGTVGTWKLDKYKWPSDTFRKSVDYGHENGFKTLVWFEPDRVTDLRSMVAKYDYKREWVLTRDNNVYLNNIGIPECLDWTADRIISFMDENNVDLYREDYNFDSWEYWDLGDGYQGKNRKGITENLNIQGHYELFDRIIAYCARTGKCTYVDSCASGGGRNDLETLRRAVPFLRSDSDRTTVELRLAFTTRLGRWLPYSGCVAKVSSGELEAGAADIYILRSSYVQHMTYSQRWHLDEESIKWNEILQSRSEWDEVKTYFYNDFYLLTPLRSTTDSQNWTAYMYFDGARDSGVIQAFRLPNCTASACTVKVKGVDPNRYYKIRDLDGGNSVARVKGSELIDGFTVTASQPRTALVMFVEPVA